MFINQTTIENIFENTPQPTKMIKLNSQIQDNSTISTHEGSTVRKDSIDASSVVNCTELFCSVYGECSCPHEINDALSNFSVASSSEENVADELSESWEMSSISTENRTPKQIKFLQIKPMDDVIPEPSTVINQVLPVFQQIESIIRCEELKIRSTQGCDRCGGRGFRGMRRQPNIFVVPKGKQVKARKQAAKYEERKSSSFSLSEGSPSWSQFQWQQQQSQQMQQTQYLSTNTTTTIEEETREKPIHDHDDCPKKHPMNRYQTMLCISFDMMNKKIKENAVVRASKYVDASNNNNDNPNKEALIVMISEVYRLLLLPEEALKLYVDCLGEEQRIKEGQEVLRRLNLKINRHPKVQQARAKVSAFYKV